MRLISNTSDYYDSGFAYGIDENIYFKREIIHKGKSDFTDSQLRYNEKNLIFGYKTTGYVGFCGKIYPFIVHRRVKEDFKKGIMKLEFNDSNSVNKFYYNYESYLDDYGDKIKKDYYGSIKQKIETIKDYFNNKVDSPFRGFNHSSNINNNYYDNKLKEKLELFTKYKTPYFIERDFGSNDNKLKEKSDDYFTTFDILGNLKSVQFSKVFNPYEAFQEISMYLGSIKSKEENKGCEISDKDRMKGHGMDCMSFRKEGKNKNKC